MGSSPQALHGDYRLFGFVMILRLGASSTQWSEIMMAVLQSAQSRRWCPVVSLSRFSRRGTCSTLHGKHSQTRRLYTPSIADNQDPSQ
ncbi:hypothetical protein AVEN_138368-1 [Araneus ventricosus]|uniref:Uncharacterized protein n=1 Tax=Araneus ventricosus TaxID=182803 RepID=A0A4Y2QHB6_ARAVE|nr:hypothetical protein AVEN_138368-1 [Araneus ventricosus]